MQPCDSDGSPPRDPERMSAVQLLPLVYDELRRLAAARIAAEGHAHALRATSLVHSVYLRLINESAVRENAWNGRAHFFASAALAMRRILVERARQRGRLRHGGAHRRVADEALESLQAQPSEQDPIDMLALDAALQELETANPGLYRVVMLRYFAGLSIAETAALLATSVNTVKRRWTVARLWLLDRVDGNATRPPEDTAGPA